MLLVGRVDALAVAVIIWPVVLVVVVDCWMVRSVVVAAVIMLNSDGSVDVDGMVPMVGADVVPVVDNAWGVVVDCRGLSVVVRAVVVVVVSSGVSVTVSQMTSTHWLSSG